MKIKRYGDFCEEMNETNNDFFSENSNSLELFKYNDISSSNTFNRPILNLQSEIEENHKALQEISKIFLQDKRTGYIKDALEGLSAENIKLITYNNKTYVRIPTGVLLVNERSNADIYTSGEDDFGNRRLGKNNDINIYVNAPNINLFERQIADHFSIDLNMPGNNVSVNYKIIIDENDNNKRKIQYTYKITTKEVEMTEGIPNILEKTYTSEDKDSNNIPIGKVSYDTVGLINHLKSRLNNKYFKNDDNYSLEELIELPDNASKAYIFLRTKSRNQENFKYSSSGNFGVYIPNDNSQDEENIVSFVSRYGGILLFKKPAGEKSSFENVITEVDRNLLELRKLDVNNVLNLNNKVKINKKGEIVTLSNINEEGAENFEIDDSINFGINGRLFVKDYGTTKPDGGDNSKVQFEWRITKKDEINSLITS